jgi:hypothetical protein
VTATRRTGAIIVAVFAGMSLFGVCRFGAVALGTIRKVPMRMRDRVDNPHHRGQKARGERGPALGGAFGETFPH